MGSTDAGLLALRLGVGASLFSHGAQKLFGWFGGAGPAGTAAYMANQGFTPGRTNAQLAGATEVVGGVLLATGLGTGPAAAMVTGTMVTAGSTTAANGFFATGGGFELPAVYTLATGALALAGPGRFSLDHLSRSRLNPGWLTLASYVTALGAAAVLIRRARSTAGAAEEPSGSDAPA